MISKRNFSRMHFQKCMEVQELSLELRKLLRIRMLGTFHLCLVTLQSSTLRTKITHISRAKSILGSDWYGCINSIYGIVCAYENGNGRWKMNFFIIWYFDRVELTSLKDVSPNEKETLTRTKLSWKDPLFWSLHVNCQCPPELS